MIISSRAYRPLSFTQVFTCSTVRAFRGGHNYGFHPVRSRVSVTDSFDISGGFLVRPCGFIPRFGADPPTMPSADFCHAIKVGLLEPSANLPRTRRSRATWQISRGKHASFRTRAPSIPAWPMMDRGLYRVLPARPTRPA